jgi:hypothetical protein
MRMIKRRESKMKIQERERKMKNNIFCRAEITIKSREYNYFKNNLLRNSDHLAL